MKRSILFACLAVAGFGAVVLGMSGASQPAHAQASLAPDDCVCSAGIVIDTVSGSRLINCQCGAMQCVVVSGSGQLQCR